MPSSLVLDRLLLLSDLLQRDMSRAFDGGPLTTARVHLLWVVHHAGPQTQQSLATALDVTPRNVTGLVDALVESGHVVRAPHPTDRRAVLVTLTGLGADTMRRMAVDHAQLDADLVADLTDDERSIVAGALDRITARLQSLMAAAAAEEGTSVEAERP